MHRKIRDIKNVNRSQVASIRRAFEDENQDAGFKKFEVWVHQITPGIDSYNIEVWQNSTP